jgi:hypothetical protein
VDVGGIVGVNDEQHMLALADGAAQNDEAVVYEGVHDRGMVGEAVLVAEIPRPVPRAEALLEHREGHAVIGMVPSTRVACQATALPAGSGAAARAAAARSSASGSGSRVARESISAPTASPRALRRVSLS